MPAASRCKSPTVYPTTLRRGQVQTSGADVSDEGIAALRDTFGRAGLAVPPIPDVLAPQVKEVGRWVFASREVRSRDVYMLSSLVDEARAGDVENYVVAAHGGHGFNSYAWTYFGALPPVVLFVPCSFGPPARGVSSGGPPGRRGRAVRECSRRIVPRVLAGARFFFIDSFL